jgi:hypothetical protein
MTIKLSAGFAFSMAFLFVTSGAAEPNKVLYELQERCAKEARGLFQKQWGDGVVKTDDGQIDEGYENHYNARLNKCFYLEMQTFYPREGTGGQIQRDSTLYDLHENKEYGQCHKVENGYTSPMCTMRGTFYSEEEWNVLLKPFMEE